MDQLVQHPRLFYALWPNNEVAEALQDAQAPLSGGRLTHIHDFHLTLVFVGHQPAETVPRLVELLDELPEIPPRLVLDRYGDFGGHSVLWVGPSQSPPALLALQSALVQRLQIGGVTFRRENNFQPHVTLARQARIASGAQIKPIIWQRPSLVLAESTGSRSGPRYRVVASH